MQDKQAPAALSAGAQRLGRAGLIVIVVAVALGVVVLVGGVDLLKPAGDGSLGGFTRKIKQIEGPATAAFAATSGLGLLAGGAMAGFGMQQGIRVMSMSGLAGAGVLLGRGLIA
jgi:hypothetical protein